MPNIQSTVWWDEAPNMLVWPYAYSFGAVLMAILLSLFHLLLSACVSQYYTFWVFSYCLGIVTLALLSVFSTS